MCSIGGYISRDAIGSVNANVLTRILDESIHRGPDSRSEFYSSPSIAIGYNRFVINDLDKGEQPFYNEDKSIICFFNGEIYNWKDLRKWLKDRGHLIKSNCDGEIIPHLYEEYGSDYPKKLEGMYAISLLDLKHHKLILTRDRVGEKPLYYSLSPQSFLFSSNIKGLMASGLVDKTVDPQSVAEFFTFRFVPHTNTILKSVKRLEPATSLSLDYDSWRISQKSYWKPNMKQPTLTSEEKAINELEDLLLNSVKLRTEVDKQNQQGSSLSGGLDSSSITALSKHHLKDTPFHSFSVHVKDDPEDLDAIKQVVKNVKTKHHWIESTTDDISLLPSVVAAMGEPISAGMTIPSLQCYQKSRHEDVRVLLTGEGSDELFGGYSGRLIMDGIIQKWPTLDSQTQAAYAKSYPIVNEKIHSDLANPKLSLLDRYVAWDDDNCFNLKGRDMLLEGGSISDIDPLSRVRDLEKLTKGTSHENAMLLLEMKLRLEGFMLVIVDRTSMACPVECRAPYLDSKIIDFAFRVSPQLKYAHGIEKYILRKAMEKTKLLPDSIIWRKKHPFSGPISTWLDYLPSNLETILTPKILDQYGFVNSKTVEKMYKDYKSGKLDKKTRTIYSDLLFGVLVITLWLEIFIQNRSVEGLSLIKDETD